MLRRANQLIPIGNGLFSSRDIPCDDTHIVYFFVGELLTDPVVINSRRAQNEQGGYYVLSNATKTLFDTSIRGQYLASMANCPPPYEYYSTQRDHPAYDNARRTYKAWGNGHYQWGLMSKKTMPAHEEILWNYGPAYIYIPLAFFD